MTFKEKDVKVFNLLPKAIIVIYVFGILFFWGFFISQKLISPPQPVVEVQFMKC